MERSSDPPRRTRLRRLARKLGVASVLIATVTYTPLHRLEDEYVVWERGADGEMARHGDRDLSLGLAFGNFWYTTTVKPRSYINPADETAAVATRRIWFLNLTGERLLRESAVAMQTALKEMPWVQETAYFPRSYLPLHESTLPDLFVTLELLNSRELHLPFYHSYEHEVRVGIGRRPLRGESDAESYRSAAHALLIVRVTGKSYGPITAARRHDVAVGTIRRSIKLHERLAEWREEFGAVEGAPEALIRSERQLPELPAAPHPARRQIYQGGYFLVHAEGHWLQDPQGRASEDLDDLAEAFDLAGWDVRYDGKAVHATRGSLYFEAMPFRKDDECSTIALFLQDRFSPEEARELLAEVVGRERESGTGPNAEVFIEHVAPNLRPGLLAALEANPIPELAPERLERLRR